MSDPYVPSEIELSGIDDGFIVESQDCEGCFHAQAEGDCSLHGGLADERCDDHTEDF